MTIDMDGHNKRVSYLHLYPVQIEDDEDSRRSEEQVTKFTSVDENVPKTCAYYSTLLLHQ